MCRNNHTIAVFLGVVLGCLLGACDLKITSSTPVPDIVMLKSPGESVTLQVTGPDPGFQYIAHSIMGNFSLGWYEWLTYSWVISFDGNTVAEKLLKRGVKTLHYTIPPDVRTNKIKITCWYGLFEYSDRPFDSRTWTIRVNRGTPPTWDGTYVIEDAADLSILKNYSSITSDLVVSESPLTTLQGLEQLTDVGGSLIVLGNPQMTTLDGLQNIKGVGGGLEISHNDALTTLGLDSLAQVKGIFRILFDSQLCTESAVALRDQVQSRGGISGEITILDTEDCTAP